MIKLYTKDIVDGKKELWFENTDTQTNQYVCNFNPGKTDYQNLLNNLELTAYKYFDVNAPTYNPLTLLSLISDKHSIQSISASWDDTHEFRGSLFGYSDDYTYGFYYVIFDRKLFSIITDIIKCIKAGDWDRALSTATFYEAVYNREALRRLAEQIRNVE